MVRSGSLREVAGREKNPRCLETSRAFPRSQLAGNGLCFSPDYRRLYAADTGPSHYPAARGPADRGRPLVRHFPPPYDRLEASQTMDSGRIHIGRMLVVCAAVFAQAVSGTAALACTNACCRNPAGASGRQDVAADAHLGPCCPSCMPRDCGRPAEPPCRCHLRARHDAATMAGSRPLLDLEHPDRFADLRVPLDSAEPLAPRERLALAAGDPVPRRPHRIMFGVWRN